MAYIDHPSAWTSAAIGGREGLTHRLGRAHVEAIERGDLDDPAIGELMTVVRHQLRHGYGAIILSGLDIGALGEDRFAEIYQALGARLGRLAIQSVKGDILGRVEQLEDNPAGRGYQSNIELGPHTDFHEILSLATVRPAATGGESGVVSSLAIYNILLAERPDLIPALEEGYWFDKGDGTNTDYKVPVFGRVDGLVSCYNHPMLMANAATHRNEELPEKLREGLAVINEIARRPGVQASFMLQPGEMLFWHNFTAFHSRTHFEDGPGAKRLLLRLWIHADDRRPMPQGFIEKAEQMDAMHARGEPGIRYDLDALRKLRAREREERQKESV